MSYLEEPYQQLTLQLSPQEFQSRFNIISSFIDPFSREYILTIDKQTTLQSVYKHYLSQNQEQQQAILDNLQNYQKLSEHQGICKLLAFTKLNQQKQILAAFEYNQFTLKQYVKTAQFINNHNKFYLRLFASILQIIKMMVEIGIDLDQINFTNLLVYHAQDSMENTVKIKVLYDQREKIYDKVVQGLKTFSSGEKLQALLKNDDRYFMEDDIMAAENIYQLGLLMIDLIYECECKNIQENGSIVNNIKNITNNNTDDFINRDMPISRNMYHNLEDYNLSYYTFDSTGKVTKNQQILKHKIQYLRNVPSQFIKVFVQVLVRMIQSIPHRISLDQLIGEAEIIEKIYKDSQRKVARSSSIQKQVISNQQIYQTHQQKTNILNNFNALKNQYNQNQITLNNNQQKKLISHKNFTQQTKIITSSKNLKSQDVKEIFQSMNNAEYDKNKNIIQDNRPYLSKNSNQFQPESNTKRNNGLENTKETYYKNNLSVNLQAVTVNDMGYKTGLPSIQYPLSYNSIVHPATQTQINGLHRILIPRQQILLNLHCHESVRGSLQNLINQLQILQNLVKKQYYDSSVYYGQTHHHTNKRNGFGIYVYPQGDIYYGTWHQNQLINGTYIFKNGQSYEGQVKNGKQGWGRYRYINGNIYEGEWKNDIKQGKGTMWYPNHDKYQGNWNKGKKNAFGKYYYNNGTIYEGNFNNGRKNGFGTIIFTNGTRIQANWNQTHVQGSGRVFYPNGDYFEGQYHYSQKHGKGLYVWGSDQAKYQGQFKKDTLQGQAKIYFTNKQYFFGRIKNGKRDGQGTYQYENGDRFIGEWKNDIKLIGNYRFVNGDQFEGKFKQNQLNFGVLKYFNGENYEGEFKNGYRNGVGSYRNKFGQLVYEGHWQMDIFINKTQ